MKQVLLSLICVGLISSCATRKYGCTHYSYSPTTNTPKPTLVSGSVKNDLLKNNQKMFTQKSKYVQPKMDFYSGHGIVVVINTHKHPYSLFIRINGVLIKNNYEISSIKYVMVYESSYLFWQLRYLVGKQVYFEFKLPNMFDSPEITTAVDGCVDHYETNYVDGKGTIHFTKI